MRIGSRLPAHATAAPPGGRSETARVFSTNINAVGKQMREERCGTVRVGTYVQAVRALGGQGG